MLWFILLYKHLFSYSQSMQFPTHMWFLNTNKNQLHVVIYTGQINVKFASAIHQKGNITDPLKLLNFLLPKLDGEARKSKLHLQRYTTKTAYKIRKKKKPSQPQSTTQSTLIMLRIDE